MAQMVCASCAQVFAVRSQSPKQTYCSAPECQRERRRRWNKGKLKTDPDYRANQLAAQRAWHARHPDYWQTYRQRQRSGALLGAFRAARATSDASSCGADPDAGLCWMEIRTAGPEGTSRTWRIELTMTCAPADCKHGRVQTEDSIAAAMPGA